MHSMYNFRAPTGQHNLFSVTEEVPLSFGSLISPGAKDNNWFSAKKHGFGRRHTPRGKVQKARLQSKGLERGSTPCRGNGH